MLIRVKPQGNKEGTDTSRFFRVTFGEVVGYSIYTPITPYTSGRKAGTPHPAKFGLGQTMAFAAPAVEVGTSTTGLNDADGFEHVGFLADAICDVTDNFDSFVGKREAFEKLVRALKTSGYLDREMAKEAWFIFNHMHGDRKQCA